MEVHKSDVQLGGRAKLKKYLTNFSTHSSDSVSQKQVAGKLEAEADADAEAEAEDRAVGERKSPVRVEVARGAERVRCRRMRRVHSCGRP